METTFKHQRAPTARFNDIFFLLKSFLASGAFFLGRKVTEQATISQVINSRHSSFFIVNKETNTSKSPGWAT